MWIKSNSDSTSAILENLKKGGDLGPSLSSLRSSAIRGDLFGSKMESPLPKRKRFSQTSDNIRRSTADKLKLFESIRGKEVANTPFWDIIVITALDQSQRDAYDIQLQSKLSRGELPLGVKYHVFYDPPGPKIGNGGSVLVTIGDLLKIYNEEELMKYKILMLPAGGYSQRLPNASVLGKAFTALPTGTYVNPLGPAGPKCLS